MIFYNYVILNFIKKCIEHYKQNQRKYSSINISKINNLITLKKLNNILKEKIIIYYFNSIIIY
jgi:ribosomal protein L18E